AFQDTQFLEAVRAEVEQVKKLAASELRRLVGSDSKQDRARREAMAADPPPAELPEGRDWESELQCGIHAGPSMNNLHVHIMSVDRNGPCLKHRRHYNSFSTPFFVPITEFPLAQDDGRRQPVVLAELLRQDLKCWRCGEDFGSSFAQLQAHLRREFEEWKQI
ncbi:aprataxin-like protein, partial [Ascosphaera acerosa]